MTITPDLGYAVWHKSGRSSAQSGACVEVAQVTEAIAVRDSKNPTGPALAFAPADWAAFVADVRRGGHDRPGRA
jgi:hypothetical protein